MVSGSPGLIIGVGIGAVPYARCVRSVAASCLVRVCSPNKWWSWQLLHQGAWTLLVFPFLTMPGLQGGGCFLPQVLQAFFPCAFHCWPRRCCSSTESVLSPKVSTNGLPEGCDRASIC
jgi:hypothetical protein